MGKAKTAKKVDLVPVANVVGGNVGEETTFDLPVRDGFIDFVSLDDGSVFFVQCSRCLAPDQVRESGGGATMDLLATTSRLAYAAPTVIPAGYPATGLPLQTQSICRIMTGKRSITRADRTLRDVR